MITKTSLKGIIGGLLFLSFIIIGCDNEKKTETPVETPAPAKVDTPASGPIDTGATRAPIVDPPAKN